MKFTLYSLTPTLPISVAGSTIQANTNDLSVFADAFGLSLFTILAAKKTIALGVSNTIAVWMGVITGIAIGMIRDLLTIQMPLLLGREFYATPALCGSGNIRHIEHPRFPS